MKQEKEITSERRASDELYGKLGDGFKVMDSQPDTVGVSNPNSERGEGSSESSISPQEAKNQPNAAAGVGSLDSENRSDTEESSIRSRRRSAEFSDSEGDTSTSPRITTPPRSSQSIVTHLGSHGMRTLRQVLNMRPNIPVLNIAALSFFVTGSCTTAATITAPFSPETTYILGGCAILFSIVRVLRAQCQTYGRINKLDRDNQQLADELGIVKRTVNVSSILSGTKFLILGIVDIVSVLLVLAFSIAVPFGSDDDNDDTNSFEWSAITLRAFGIFLFTIAHLTLGEFMSYTARELDLEASDFFKRKKTRDSEQIRELKEKLLAYENKYGEISDDEEKGTYQYS